MSAIYFPPTRKNEIIMVRGTTKTLAVTVLDASGKPYQMADGDVVRFGIKVNPADEKCLVQKEVTSLTDGVATITIKPEDTIGLQYGPYYYDVGLQSGEDYFCVIPYSRISIVPNITRKEW